MEDGCTGPLRACLIFLVFLIINGIMSAYSTALRNAPEAEIEHRAESGDKKAKGILKLQNEPLLFVNTTQTVTVCICFIAGWFGFRYFARSIGDVFARVMPGTGILPDILSAVLVLWALLIILLSAGFLTPKKIALQHPDKTLNRYYGFVRFLMILMKPVTVPVSVLTNLLVRLFGMDPDKTKEKVTEEEIISMVDEAHENGVIKGNEAEMIQNIISFEDTDARDVMTHRKNIVAIEGETTLQEAADFMLKSSNSRFPVYDGDIDNMIGVLHLKDVMKALLSKEKNDTIAIEDIPNLVRQAAVIPETRSIDSIFQMMRTKKVHLVIVVDEYGQTSGLITMEDILEEIVGSILDEYDDDETYIQHSFDNSIVMDGLTPLDRVSEVLNFDFGDEQSETLNGYLTKILDHVPTSDDKVVTGEKYLFKILKIENHTIKKVRVERLPEEKGEEACQDIQNSQT